MKVNLMFRIDIGFNQERGYGAVVLDVPNGRQKGIRAASIEQLVSRIRNVVLEEARKKKNFPLESESAGTRSIITPGDGDPLFRGIP